MRETIRLDDEEAVRRLGRLVRAARQTIGWTQAELAARARTSQSQVARLERHRAPAPDIDVLARLLAALDLNPSLSVSSIALDDRREQRTVVHGVTLAYVARRLERAGWQARTEVPVGDPPRAWIDLLGFRAADGGGLLGEVKGDLPDIGALRRQVTWYERIANQAMRSLGWRPRRITTLVTAVDSARANVAIRQEAGQLAPAFPGLPDEMDAWLRDPGAAIPRPTLALVDPASRRERWLLRTPLSGRRSAPAYEDYADAARRLTTRRRPRGPPGRRTRPGRSRPP